MDDLSGLSWSQNSAPGKNVPTNPLSSVSTLHPTPPLSGRSSPFPPQSAANNRTPSSKPTTSSNDSFANLLNFQSTNSTKNLSLAERQKQLVEQRAREERERQEKLKAQYGGVNDQIWDSLEKSGAGQSAPPAQLGGVISQTSGDDDDDDLLAAFNASAPVDKSTNFPIPSSSPSLHDRTKTQSPAVVTTTAIEDDDDPFGLAEFNASRRQRAQAQPTKEPALEDDDDVLGLLAKPVSEFPKRETASPAALEIPEESGSLPSRHTPEDRAIAELVDMGFPIDKAREALAETSSGTDVQQAVGWLLNQAHSQAKEKAQSRSRTGRQESNSPGPDMPRRTRRENGGSNSSRDRSSHNVSSREKDPAQLASEFGSSLFKSANSLWKTGSKRVQQAVQEFNGAPDSSGQPRWMRESTPDPPRSRERKVDSRREPPGGSSETETMTNEAMMLETSRDLPAQTSRPRGGEPLEATHQPSTRGRLAELPSRPRFQQEDDLRKQIRQPLPQNETKPPRSQLSRFGADEQAAQAYVSPARRRKAASSVPPGAPEPDLLQSPAMPPRPTRPATTSPARQTRTPTPVRPKVAPRVVPQISPTSLTSIHSHRKKGTDAYKRGDYAVAHVSYSSAISLIPNEHPILIILLTNRALTGLKTGEPKNAISDADRALSVIGPSKGDSELIDLGNGEPTKDMREFYGKALMRKAEALEQLEKWKDALAAWREAIESGHGGNTSIQGRDRCEKAATIGQNGASSTPVKPTSVPTRPKPAARPAVPKSVSAKPAEAVTRLRAANEEADRLDNEKFDLADAVEAKLTAWKGGKQDNLRALLASLDAVLWPEAGWKKISMAELILPNKVKIQYMKGIAKVHPDKIPVNATTEQKMISGAVFSTLNEAWDKFKRENGL
ncbi:UBA/TS-N domain protein [Arthroderma uncinatum]|uniref:UBA/TS-N domain protein n=1 Tax=Arthroderma uncinatum TaxID=74035 RepID=UPI00144A79AB|nr:UBA/TS-N domain protein [Arthroderma uncinatum]KAF3479453.1 UBA/TS-N domain protein [Arthroderma uncinatum]